MMMPPSSSAGGVENVAGSAQQGVEPAAAEARNQTDEGTENGRSQGGENADKDRRSGPVHRPGVHVTPLDIGTKPVYRRRDVPGR